MRDAEGLFLVRDAVPARMTCKAGSSKMPMILRDLSSIILFPSLTM